MNTLASRRPFSFASLLARLKAMAARLGFGWGHNLRLGDAYRLADKRYTSGIDSYLGVLDAQRSHFAARQGLASLRLAKLSSQIQLYTALGGGTN